MRFFSKRETPVQNLALIALVSGIDALLCLISALLPAAALFLMLVVPFLSAMVCLLCKARYLPIYILVAMGASIGLTAWNLLGAVYYLLPSLLTGTLYGLLWKLKLPLAWTLFLTSLLAFLLFYLSLYVTRLLVNADMVEVLLTMIGRAGDEKARTVFPLFAYGYSLAQIAFMHLFCALQAKRLGASYATADRLRFLYAPLAFLFCGTAIGIAFIHAKTAYFLLGCGLFWTVFSFGNLFPSFHRLTLLPMGIGAFIGIMLFAALYVHLPETAGLVLLGAAPSLAALGSMMNPLFLSLRTKGASRD